jgi:hypothetical protein
MRPLDAKHAVAAGHYMKQILLTVTVLLAVGAAACKDKTTTPTTTTTTTAAATTTTTAATTTTTSIAAPTQFTLTGRITDSGTNQGIPLADIEIIEGANIGRTQRAGADGNYTLANLNPGTFTMRVRAFGYPSTDVRVTITNANLRLDIPIAPLPVSTTTTTSIGPTLKADFIWTPDPCTVSGAGPVTDCTVDAIASIGNIAGYKFDYAGKTVLNNARFRLTLACGDLTGTGTDVTVSVSLTVTEAGSGATDTVTKSVPVTKINGACP